MKRFGVANCLCKIGNIAICAVLSLLLCSNPVKAQITIIDGDGEPIIIDPGVGGGGAGGGGTGGGGAGGGGGGGGGSDCPECYEPNPNHDPSNPYCSEPPCIPAAGDPPGAEHCYALDENCKWVKIGIDDICQDEKTAFNKAIGLVWSAAWTVNNTELRHSWLAAACAGKKPPGWSSSPNYKKILEQILSSAETDDPCEAANWYKDKYVDPAKEKAQKAEQHRLDTKNDLKECLEECGYEL